MSHDDGEGPTTRDEARERVAKWFDKPEHRKPKPGKSEPKEDALDDPALIEEGEDK